jgi:hypothetical protein
MGHLSSLSDRPFKPLRVDMTPTFERISVIQALAGRSLWLYGLIDRSVAQQLLQLRQEILQWNRGELFPKYKEDDKAWIGFRMKGPPSRSEHLALWFDSVSRLEDWVRRLSLYELPWSQSLWEGELDDESLLRFFYLAKWRRVNVMSIIIILSRFCVAYYRKSSR